MPTRLVFDLIIVSLIYRRLSAHNLSDCYCCQWSLSGSWNECFSLVVHSLVTRNSSRMGNVWAQKGRKQITKSERWSSHWVDYIMFAIKMNSMKPLHCERLFSDESNKLCGWNQRETWPPGIVVKRAKMYQRHCGITSSRRGAKNLPPTWGCRSNNRREIYAANKYRTTSYTRCTVCATREVDT